MRPPYSGPTCSSVTTNARRPGRGSPPIRPAPDVDRVLATGPPTPTRASCPGGALGERLQRRQRAAHERGRPRAGTRRRPTRTAARRSACSASNAVAVGRQRAVVADRPLPRRLVARRPATRRCARAAPRARPPSSRLPPPSAIAGAPERSARSTTGSSRGGTCASPYAAKNDAMLISSWSSSERVGVEHVVERGGLPGAHEPDEDERHAARHADRAIRCARGRRRRAATHVVDVVAAELRAVGVGEHERDHRLADDAGRRHRAGVRALAQRLRRAACVAMSTERSGLVSVGSGFIAARATSGSPFVMPPSRPPAWFVSR